MIRGTTPTLTIALPVQPSLLSACYISFYQEVYENYAYVKRRYVEKSLADCELDDESFTVSVTLSQSDTLSFSADKPVLYQIRFRVGNVAYASSMETIPITDVLKGGEI